MKYVYSVAVRHQNSRKNLYQINSDTPLEADDLIASVRQEIATARTVLVSVHPMELAQAA